MTTRQRILGAAGVTIWAMAASGCLLKDVTQTWYLKPDAGVTWQITERHVRSDADSAADRQADENEYMTNVRVQTHPVALGLTRLGGTMLQTRILHAPVPFAVVTEATFADIGQLGRQILAASGVAGWSVLERTPAGFTWTLSFIDADGDGDAGGHDDEAISAVMSGFENLKVVLADGRFTAAQGFELSGDKRVASLVALNDDEHAADQKARVMSLSWGR